MKHFSKPEFITAEFKHNDEGDYVSTENFNQPKMVHGGSALLLEPFLMEEIRLLYGETDLEAKILRALNEII